MGKHIVTPQKDNSGAISGKNDDNNEGSTKASIEGLRIAYFGFLLVLGGFDDFFDKQRPQEKLGRKKGVTGWGEEGTTKEARHDNKKRVQSQTVPITTSPTTEEKCCVQPGCIRRRQRYIESEAVENRKAKLNKIDCVRVCILSSGDTRFWMRSHLQLLPLLCCSVAL